MENQTVWTWIVSTRVIMTLSLLMINLDTVWENIIAQVGNIEVEPGKTLDEQIKLNEEREKLQQRIESLERLARAEKQPRKKFELVQEIKKLENEINAL
jgi:regulator of replication initiation timing